VIHPPRSRGCDEELYIYVYKKQRRIGGAGLITCFDQGFGGIWCTGVLVVCPERRDGSRRKKERKKLCKAQRASMGDPDTIDMIHIKGIRKVLANSPGARQPEPVPEEEEGRQAPWRVKCQVLKPPSSREV
jgi:hypothetical protein